MVADNRKKDIKHREDKLLGTRLACQVMVGNNGNNCDRAPSYRKPGCRIRHASEVKFPVYLCVCYLCDECCDVGVCGLLLMNGLGAGIVGLTARERV